MRLIQAKINESTSSTLTVTDTVFAKSIAGIDSLVTTDNESDTSIPLKESLSAPLKENIVASIQLDESENEEILTEHNIPDSPQLVDVLPIETAPNEPVEPKLRRYGRKSFGSKKLHVTERKKSIENVESATPDNLQESKSTESSDETYSQLRKRKTNQTKDESSNQLEVETEIAERDIKPSSVEKRVSNIKRKSLQKAKALEQAPAEKENDEIVAPSDQRFDEHTSAVIKTQKSKRKSNVETTTGFNEMENAITVDNTLKRKPRSKKATVLSTVQIEEDDIIQNSNEGNHLKEHKKLHLESPSVKERLKTTKRVRTASNDQKSGNSAIVKVMFTGISENDEHRQIVQRLCGTEVEAWQDCTHLVTDKIRRTTKFLCSLSAGKHIVDLKWLSESEKQGQFITDTSKFLLKDVKTEKQFRMNLKKSLQKTSDVSNPKLFAGLSIYATPNLKPPFKELFEILEAAGGKLLVKPPTSMKSNVYVCGTTQDESDCKKLQKMGYKIYSNELILSSILRQEIDLERYFFVN